jgi:hydroxyacylglutathione hydrolase
MFQRHFDEGLAQASFFIGCPRTKQAVVIDPRRDVDVYVEAARAHGYDIVHSIETHVHADFACGSNELAAIGARTVCGPGSRLQYPNHEVAHGETMQVGDLALQFLHTPGHTPEHISILVRQPGAPVRLFTGDTLFVGAVGRPDLLGEEQTRQLASQLYDSLFNKILTLDADIEVHPGHGSGSLCGAGIGSDPFTTVGQERRFNPMLQHKNEAEFVAAVLSDLPDTPPYFPRMKQLNAAGATVLGLAQGYAGPAAVSAAEAADAMRNGSILIDLRKADVFASGHPRGALNLAYGSKIGYWGGYVLPTDAHVLLLGGSGRETVDAARQLLRIGLSNIDGFVEGGFDAWRAAGLPVGTITLTDVEGLEGALQGSAAPLVIDVRTAKEWTKDHIASAMHIPLGDLEARASEIPRDRTAATMCEAGYRSSLAASILARAGVERLVNVTGGMSAWRALTTNARA